MIKSILRALGLIQEPPVSVYYNAATDKILFMTYSTRELEHSMGKTTNSAVAKSVLSNSEYLGTL